MGTVTFSCGKTATFPEIKEMKGLGVRLAQRLGEKTISG